MAVLLIFLPQLSVNFIRLGARQNRPNFGDTPDQADRAPHLIGPDQLGSGLINQDWAQPDPSRPDWELMLVMLSIEDPILVKRRLATMPENGALLHRACPDEPDDGKYEYYYVSYSY